jgi:hypothetical protein
MKTKLMIVLALAACSKSENKAPKPEAKVVESKVAKPAEPPKTPPLPVKAFVEQDTKQLGWKPQVVLGKTPDTLAKELPQYLRQDKTSAAVSAKTDEMMAGMKEDMKKHGIDVDKKRSDIEFRLPPTPGTTDETTHVILHQDDDGTVRQYGVWFKPSAAERAEITKAFDELWGANKVVKETLGPRTTWFDANLGMRASTKVELADHEKDRLDIDYVRYLPLAKFFGEPGALWGFEKPDRPLIGATVEQLQAAYGKIEVDKDGGTAKLELPPTDYDGNSSHTLILMFLEKGKVKMWNTSIPFDEYEPARAEYEALLDAKFGKPKAARREHFIYAKKIDVNYSKFTHELDIEVTK